MPSRGARSASTVPHPEPEVPGGNERGVAQKLLAYLLAIPPSPSYHKGLPIVIGKYLEGEIDDYQER
jgi:hypothetical protein